MAEIKSTLELAMERTNKITISDKERKEMKRREIDQKVNALSHRYIEGHLPLNEILREIERMDEKRWVTVKEAVLSQWIDALSLNGEGERLLKGIGSLKHRSADDLKQEHHQLISQYRREKESLKEKVRAQLAEALRSKGIDGSAVEPNAEGSQLWKKESEDLDYLYGSKLEELKERWRAL